MSWTSRRVAIVAQAQVKGALFAVLSFPLLIPVLILGVSITRKAMDLESITEAGTEIRALIGLAGVMMTVSIWLFDAVWRD